MSPQTQRPPATLRQPPMPNKGAIIKDMGVLFVIIGGILYVVGWCMWQITKPLTIFFRAKEDAPAEASRVDS